MQNSKFWFFLFICLLPAILPLFKPYVSGTADGLGHRFRLVSFYNSLKEGNIRPRWAKEAALGFGAPTFLFNYPLPYYLGSLFMNLGFSVNRSGQILAALSLFLSGFFMFLAGRKLFGNLGGLVSAVVYTYAPYHLLTVYLYEGWGEMTAFVFPPLILYLMLKAQNCNFCILHFAFLILFWVLFILSHNVSVLMFAPMLLLLGFVISRNRVRPYIVSTFLLAVILSAFFWLPAVVLQNEMKYPVFLITEGAMRGSFFKSFSFQWETAFRVIKEGTARYLDFTVGLPILLIGLIGFISPMRNIRLLLLLSVSFYLTNYLSNWIWNFPPFTYILYPFRFLFVASFLGALLGGLVAKKNRILAAFVIIFSIIQGVPYLNPYVDIFPFTNDYFYQRQTVTAAPGTKKNMLIREFLPKDASVEFLEKIEREGDKKEELFEYNGSELTINRFYFPNWEIKVDGELRKASIDQEGRMVIAAPAGSRKIEMNFGVSGIEKVANAISVFGVILSLILWKRLS